MTENRIEPLDLYEIERQARVLRAQATVQGLRAARRWISERLSHISLIGARRTA